jgi:hypothetical protein
LKDQFQRLPAWCWHDFLSQYISFFLYRHGVRAYSCCAVTSLNFGFGGADEAALKKRAEHH